MMLRTSLLALKGDFYRLIIGFSATIVEYDPQTWRSRSRVKPIDSIVRVVVL
ncbi:MAG: hypothetical protein QNJ72_32560 [Pleurocapsa sp. MO_226.B13]|nr:hypothetical protein [Pleurocapsa sp. MO_226.B13]